MTVKADFGKMLDLSYRSELLKRLEVEPVLVRIMRQEADMKKQMIHDTLHPFHRWLLLRTKWRWLIRGYHWEQHFTGEKLILRLYRGNKLLRQEEIDRRPITFRRYTGHD